MRILLVDDHALVRGILARFLSQAEGIQVVGEAGNGEEALVAARKLQPDIVLMDIRMPVSNGIEATQRIKEEMPGVKVVALTVSEDMGDLAEAFKSGAEGYMLKSATPEELIAGLRQVWGGETALSSSVAARVFRELRQESSRRGVLSTVRHLSPREVEILRLVAEGASNKEIGARLSLRESTVRNHMHHVLGKLQVRNRMQAALFAESRGLLSS